MFTRRVLTSALKTEKPIAEENVPPDAQKECFKTNQPADDRRDVSSLAERVSVVSRTVFIRKCVQREALFSMMISRCICLARLVLQK